MLYLSASLVPCVNWYANMTFITFAPDLLRVCTFSIVFCHPVKEANNTTRIPSRRLRSTRLMVVGVRPHHLTSSLRPNST